MAKFEHIAVVGIGLIGGSLALAARRAGLADRITGTNGGAPVDAAIRMGVIDEEELSFDEGRVCEADLIFLAAPVNGIIDFLRRRGGQIRRGALVSDSGSAKRAICEAARANLPESVRFVGGHPMAGSERAGVEYASANLFAGLPYVLITDGQPPGLATMIEVAQAFGARPVLMSAAEHDEVVARVSHLPQLLSTVLAASSAQLGPDEAARVAGPGFAAMTRLAASRWTVWEDILRANAEEVREALDRFSAELERARKALAEGDFASLGEIFERANRFAEAIAEGKANANRSV